MKGTLSLVAFALVLALASCGGGSSGGGGGSGSSAGTNEKVIKTVAIKETEWKLSPSRVTLSKPGTYAFKAENRGDDQHSLTIVGKGVKAKVTKPNSSRQLTLGKTACLR